MIEEFAALIPRSESIWKESGAMFYSGKAAFSAPSRPRLYILGLNPGGSPQDMAEDTVEKHTQMVLRETENWSAYRDEQWGKTKMQPRVLRLFKNLNRDPGLVPASNVVFVRSRRAADIKHDFEKYAECCWRFHKAVIERLNVRAILCLGQDAGNFVLEKHGLRNSKPFKTFVEKNNRHWTNNSYISSCGIGIFVATHPSRADWTNPDTDPSPLVQNMLDTLT